MSGHKLRAPYFQVTDGNVPLLKISEIVIWERTSRKIEWGDSGLGNSEMSQLSAWQE